MEYSAIIGAIINAATSAMGKAIADGQHLAARQVRADIIEQYGDEIAPVLDEIIIDEFGENEFSKIVMDSESRRAQKGTFDALRESYEKGGMTEADEAALALANEGVAKRAGGEYANLQRALSQRGQSLSPAQAASMAAQTGQDAVNATGLARYQSQADARNRAMSALQASGALASQIRGDDYRQLSDAARAQNELNRFNRTSRMDAQRYNNELRSAGLQNKLALRDRRARAMDEYANSYITGAARTESAWGGVGDAASDIGDAFAEYDSGKKKKKED